MKLVTSDVVKQADASLNRARQYRLAHFSAHFSDVIFLLSDPDFIGDEISRLSRLIFEI